MRLSQCLNWKVGLGVLGAILIGYFIFPSAIGRFAPLLVLLICLLSMLLYDERNEFL